MVGKNVLEHPKAKEHLFFTPSHKELNLKNFDEVNSYIRAKNPEIIIHAAGKVGGIQANMTNPVDFLIDNLDKKNNISKLLNLGSSCMYPRNAENPLKESYILKGELEPTNEGYALAKIMTAKLCEYISNKDQSKKYKTIIPCNLYGRHDKFDEQHSHTIPAVIKKIYDATIKNQDKIDIWGDGLARREFMYAGDLADFIFKAIESFEELPQNINVGLGFDYSINEYYEAIAKVIGFQGDFVHDISKPVGMKQKLIDDSLLKYFGWQHQTSLEEGIEKTVEFYKTNN